MLLQSPREIIDPHGTLPTVRLTDRQIDVPHDPNAKVYAIEQEGEEIGATVITEVEGARMFKRIQVYESRVDIHNRSRTRGLGLAICLAGIEAAQEERKALRTDNGNLSPLTVRRWRKLIDLGVAELIEPFVLQECPVSYLHNDDTYRGYARVPYPFTGPLHR